MYLGRISAVKVTLDISGFTAQLRSSKENKIVREDGPLRKIVQRITSSTMSALLLINIDFDVDLWSPGSFLDHLCCIDQRPPKKIWTALPIGSIDGRFRWTQQTPPNV